MTKAERVKRLERLRKLAVKGWTQSEIAFDFKMSVSGVAGLLQRAGIKLTPKKGGRKLHGEGRRPRISRISRTKDSSSATPAASTIQASTSKLATHVVVERMRQVPKTMPPCLWQGCAHYTMTLGKPYCVEHHKQAGGLFCT